MVEVAIARAILEKNEGLFNPDGSSLCSELLSVNVNFLITRGDLRGALAEWGLQYSEPYVTEPADCRYLQTPGMG